MTQTFKCLFGEVRLTLPDTVEEFNRLAGDASACLTAATRYVVYHKSLGDAREDIVEALAVAFDFPRREIDTGKKRKDGTAILVDEDTDSYVRRLFADKGWDTEEPPKEYLDVLSGLAIEFDPSTKVRERKAKTLPKFIVELINQVYAAGKQDKAATALGVTFGSDEAENRKLLGWALKAREDAKRKASEGQLKSEFA